MHRIARRRIPCPNRPNGTHTHGPSLSPFIGSEVGAENIVLEGGGVIDGNGKNILFNINIYT